MANNEFGDPRLRGDMQAMACNFLVAETRNKALDEMKSHVEKNDDFSIGDPELFRFVPFYELYCGGVKRLRFPLTDKLLFPEKVLEGLTIEEVSIDVRPNVSKRGLREAKGVVIMRRKSRSAEDDEVTRLRVHLVYDDPGYGMSLLKPAMCKIERM